MQNKKIIIINDNKNILDIDIYKRLDIIFTRLDEFNFDHKRFCNSDGCIFDIEIKENECYIHITYDYKYTQRGRYLWQRKVEKYIKENK